MTIDVGDLMNGNHGDGNDDASNIGNKMKEKWIVNLANSNVGGKIVYLLNSFLNVSSLCDRLLGTLAL